MAVERILLDDLSEDENVTLNFLIQQLAGFAPANQARTDMYDAKVALRSVSSVIPPQYNRLNLALGWPAKAVDGLARRCNLEEMTWTDGNLATLGFDELADANFLYSEVQQAITSSLTHGLAYLITTQGAEDEPKALIHSKDALNATGEWNNRKRRLDNLLSVTSRKDGKITGFVLYLDGVTINADKVDAVWVVDRSTHPWHVPAEPLPYRPTTSKRMGRSRISRPVMSHTRSALRALSRLEAHMDVYSIPKEILLGASDRMFRNPDGSYKAAAQIALGRILAIPDDDDPQNTNARASYQQVQASSPEPHLADLNALAKLMARDTDLPDSDFALTDMANPTSAEAYDSGRDALISEAEGATRNDWSPAIRRTVTRALAIQNGLEVIPAEWASITTKWRDPRFLSKAAQADAGSKMIAALPWLAETRTGMEMLGLTPDQIDQALADRRRARGDIILASLAPVTSGQSAAV